MAKSDKKQKAKKQQSKKQPNFIGMRKLAQHVADYLQECALEVVGGNHKTIYLHEVIYAVLMDKVIEPLQNHPADESENAEDGAIAKAVSYEDELNPESVFANIYKGAMSSGKFESSLKTCLASKNMHLAIEPKDEDWLQHFSIGSFYTANAYNFNGVTHQDFPVVPITILAVAISRDPQTNGVLVD